MIRVVFAVAVAAALLSASLPAVESARADRTAAALDRAAERVERAGASLRETEPARVVERSGSGGADGGGSTSPPTARRVVTVDRPRRSLLAAGVDALAICPGDDATDAVFVYAVEGGDTVRRRLAGEWDVPPGGIAIDASAGSRLVLEPVTDRGSGCVGIRVRAPGRREPHGDSNTETEPASPCD
ncbi:DUF7311 family protein [Halobaculum sp. EA56]|uniref:DUF7311 family protein n=1 Tax=Halobaculum sp. EA56 TaxID=3421648 RepID=UPI003EBA7B96